MIKYVSLALTVPMVCLAMACGGGSEPAAPEAPAAEAPAAPEAPAAEPPAEAPAEAPADAPAEKPAEGK